MHVAISIKTEIKDESLSRIIDEICTFQFIFSLLNSCLPIIQKSQVKIGKVLERML